MNTAPLYRAEFTAEFTADLISEGTHKAWLPPELAAVSAAGPP